LLGQDSVHLALSPTALHYFLNIKDNEETVFLVTFKFTKKWLIETLNKGNGEKSAPKTKQAKVQFPQGTHN
jgi:hypothetical protein